jgi:hypothetical protein
MNFTKEPALKKVSVRDNSSGICFSVPYEIAVV